MNPAARAGEAAAPALVGLLGGTFDPPHRGHLQLALHFASVLPMRALWLIPAGQPWQKSTGITPARHRLAMAELAAVELRDMLAARLPTVGLPLPEVGVSRIEIDHEGPTYTTETLGRLRAELGAQTPLVWLMGADQLQRLHTWRNWQQLFAEAHLCVAARPGYGLDALPDVLRPEITARLATPALLQSRPSGCVLLDHSLAIELSSTALRQQLARGASDLPGLPAGVASYIARHHLYT